MIVGAAVLPHPPLLLAELTGLLDAGVRLRQSCAEAVCGVLATGPDEVVIVGSTDIMSTDIMSTDGPGTGPAAPNAVLDVRAYGSAAPHPPAGTPLLPLSLGIGTRLLDDAAWRGTRTLWAVAHDAPPADCLDLGRVLASRPGRTALLVMGDASARRSTTAPGFVDERARPFDTSVTEALEAGDATALATLDPDLAAALLAAGRAPWQVLAGALPEAEARLLTAEDPYGVLYVVATWVPYRVTVAGADAG